MLYSTTLYDAILYYTILYYAILYCIVLYYTVTILHYARILLVYYNYAVYYTGHTICIEHPMPGYAHGMVHMNGFYHYI